MNWEEMSEFIMEQSVIDNLPDILKHTNTLKNLSCDYRNKQYMIANQKIAIDFDKVKNLYNNENNNDFELKSNDALYITKNDIHYFIEFKNGNIIGTSTSKNKTNQNRSNQYIITIYDLKQKLQLKMYDSIFILSDIKYPNGNIYIEKYKNNSGISITNIIDFSKNYIEYILVYNSKKNGQLKNKSHWINKGKINLLKLFGLAKFEKFLLKKVYIYDEKEFETKFINGTIANEP